MRTMLLRSSDWYGNRMGRPVRRRAQDRLGRVAAALRVWRERRRSRAELARLDAHMLRDIGVTRAEAAFEFDKPFWRE